MADSFLITIRQYAPSLNVVSPKSLRLIEHTTQRTCDLTCEWPPAFITVAAAGIPVALREEPVLAHSDMRARHVRSAADEQRKRAPVREPSLCRAEDGS